ncbi:MAG: sodium-independent anion transporter [Acidobacteriota bacterium]
MVSDFAIAQVSPRQVDATALDMLRDLHRDLDRVGLSLSLAELKQPVHDALDQAGFLDDIGDKHLFLALDEAVDAQEGRH